MDFKFSLKSYKSKRCAIRICKYEIKHQFNSQKTQYQHIENIFAIILMTIGKFMIEIYAVKRSMFFLQNKFLEWNT